MKVKELITRLQELDGDRIVILQGDSEGNSYRQLSDLWTGVYSYTWGECGPETLTDANIEEGYTEEDMIKGEKAVILAPV